MNQALATMPVVNKPAKLSVRLTADGHRLLGELSDKLGVSKASVIELAIRRLAASEWVEEVSAVADEDTPAD